MADELTVVCPLCGNKVAAGVPKCPICATDLRAVVARKSTKAGPKKDYLRGEIPKTNIPVAKQSCPLCGMDLNGSESKCPRCGIPLSSSSAMLECPDCGAVAPVGSKSCPQCGVGFRAPEAPGPPVPIPVPTPLTPPPPQPAPVPLPPLSASTPTKEYFRSGGQGLTNGRGAINGTGLVNGTGITNGTLGEGQLGTRPTKGHSVLVRWQFLAVLVTVVVVISSFVYLSYSTQNGQVTIDGDFGDWKKAQMLGMEFQASVDSIKIDHWAVSEDGQRVGLYVKALGGIMSSANVDSYYLFIDSDNDALTGYSVSAIGAEFLLELDGWNGSAKSTSIGEYSSTTDQHNWTAWTEIGGLDCRVVSSELEALAVLPVSPGANARFLLMTQTGSGMRGSSYAVPSHGGLLVVKSELVDAGGVVASGASVAMARLTLHAEGADGFVDDITPVVTGAKLAGSVYDVTLKAGQTQIVTVNIDSSSSTSRSVATVSITEDDITSSFAEVEILGGTMKSYVTAPPQSISIDGAFGDWSGKTTPDVDNSPVPNPDIDIGSTGAVNDTSSSSFYVSVRGQICNGSYVPALRVRPTGGGGGGGVLVPTRISGEDVLRVFVDSDLNNSTGYPVSLGYKLIGGDYLVEVLGMNGIIEKTIFYAYQTGRWIAVSGVQISAANDEQRMEIGVPSSAIGGSSSIDFIVETSDWRAKRDSATSTPSSSAGSLAVMQGWVVDAGTTSPDATASSNQRKLIWDGVNFWSFYFDGATTMCKYTMDGGSTWILAGAVFSTTGVNGVSVWYDASSSIVYAVGDSNSGTRDVNVQKGTISPAMHTISWQTIDSTARVSTRAMPMKNSFISRDANGYLWVLSNNMTAQAPARYDLSVFRSSLPNDISAWTSVGNMLAVDEPAPDARGAVVPAGTGSDIWVVYGYDGNVAARKFTGTWSGQYNISLRGGTDNPSNTGNSPPSALVDERGVLHVIYGDSHTHAGATKPRPFYVYNNGGWSTPLRLDNPGGNTCDISPTLSVDASTGSLYAFWLRADAAGAGRTAMAQKNTSGAWTTLTLSPQTADTKQHLTSIYSVPSECYICWQWTQNSTAPLHVLFDRLPEFGGLVVPLVFSMSVMMVLIGRSRGLAGRRRS